MLQSQENQPQLFPLAAGVAVPECIGAHAARGEKPRLGLSSLTTASHLGFAVCNSTTALGLRAGWVENRDGAYRCARYYDPTIGRFISEDPLGFAGSGTNFYSYVHNNPINLTDPLGLCDKKPSCLQVFWNAFKDAMNPFGPSLSSLSDPLAAYLSAQQWNAAMEYAATKGLLYPLKSSVFRSKVASSATTAGAGFLIGVDLSLAQALWAEYQAAAAGECQ